MRNKPKEPPKVPKAAPFFLPTVAGLEPKFDVGKGEEAGHKVFFFLFVCFFSFLNFYHCLFQLITHFTVSLFSDFDLAVQPIYLFIRFGL